MEVAQDLDIKDLILELSKAHCENLIPFYNVGRCSSLSFASSDKEEQFEYFDIYIGLFSKDMEKEDAIKQYIREKYGTIIRAISVEMYSHHP